ncbi:MAG: CapA family protein [Hyphomicrobiaceae bacterium]
MPSSVLRRAGRWLLLLACALPLGAQSATARTIVFRDACRPGDRLTIAAVGDLLFHKQLLAQAFQRRGSFARMWAPVASVLKRADLAYGNLEGPAADGVSAFGRPVRDPGRRLDMRVYGYMLPTLSFNYHPSVLDDLKASGFKVISTANNHALDRGALGVDRTVDNLRRRGLAFTGTRRRGEHESPWSTVTQTKGWRIAWLACTYSTNGLPDRHRQVLFCHRQKDEVLAELARLRADPRIDAVIVTPHWGIENSHSPTLKDRALARELVDAGAAAVIGTHPHVVQPWERHVAPDGREGLIVYSTGNFISNQRQPMQRAGIIATLELARRPGGKAEVTGAGFVPTFVAIGSGHRVVENSGVAPHQLRQTLRILPDGNRVSLATPFAFAKTCGKTPLVAGSRVLPPGLVLAGLKVRPHAQGRKLRRSSIGAKRAKMKRKRKVRWRRGR